MIKYKKLNWRRYHCCAPRSSRKTSVDDSFEPTYFML